MPKKSIAAKNRIARSQPKRLLPKVTIKKPITGKPPAPMRVVSETLGKEIVEDFLPPAKPKPKPAPRLLIGSGTEPVGRVTPYTPNPVPTDSLLHTLPNQPTEATHIQYSREPLGKDPGCTIIIPANCWGDFSSFKIGRVQWGRMRWDTDFVPVGPQTPHVDELPPASALPGSTARVLLTAPARPIGYKPAPANSKPKPAPSPLVATSQPRQPGFSRKREGVCDFIDRLIYTGKYTAEQIRDLTLKEFPGRDPKSTLSTVRCRPSQIKNRGKMPPFKKS